MKPYSLDLRTRVLADYDSGMTTQAIAEEYRISTKCVRDLRQLREETGHLTPLQGKTGPKPKLVEHAEQLATLVQEQPDATLEELQQRLPVWVSLSTIWRALVALSVTLILDKLPAHKVAGIREAIEAFGVQLQYLPPSSPDPQNGLTRCVQTESE